MSPPHVSHVSHLKLMRHTSRIRTKAGAAPAKPRPPAASSREDIASSQDVGGVLKQDGSAHREID
jgi:hypothetical protein